MNKQIQMAIDMIAQGYDLNLVLDITGLEPDILMDILAGMSEGEVDSTPMIAMQTLQRFDSKSIGLFKINVN